MDEVDYLPDIKPEDMKGMRMSLRLSRSYVSRVLDIKPETINSLERQEILHSKYQTVRRLYNFYLDKTKKQEKLGHKWDI